ncbi:MAG: MFS transporter [Nitrospirota bacterium]|jgi:MFS family permease
MRTTGRFSAIRYRDFQLFWAGQVVSFSGTWMQSTAQGWLVYSLTKSPFDLGIVYMAASLPILLFSLLGGAAADRFPKRNLLLFTQSISIVPALLIGVLTSLGVVTVWHVVVLACLLGTVNAVDIPTRQSFLIEMVEKPNLLSAIALNSAAFNGARMIGPVLAGIIITSLGVAACFYLNAASFLAVVLALALVRTPGLRSAGTGNLLRDIAQGVGFIRTEPGVRRPILLVAAFSLFGLPFISQLPVFAEDILGKGAQGLGFLTGASGAGALVAALTLAFKGDIREKDRFMGLASIVLPATLVAFSLSRSYPLSLGLMVAIGLLVVAFLAAANSAVQLRTPDGIRGRVMSVYTLVFLGMAPAGYLLVGSVAGALGSARAITLSASLCLMISITIVARTRQ